MTQNELTKNAIARARKSELDNFQRALDIQWLNNRMEDGRMGRSLALINKESQMEKEFQERTDHAAIVNARAKKETTLGIEVAKIRHDQESELLRHYYLRERDPSLRELMKKLQAGYVCRDLRQQILHNEYKRLQEKAEEARANALILESLGTEKEIKDREELEKIKKNSAYCHELQQQLVNRQLVRQCQYEDQLVEQKMLDDVMRTIADEDQRELKQKRDLMHKMQQEMVTFKQAREAWRAKQRELAIKEELEIEKQQQASADRSAGIVAERARQVRIKEEINAKISAKIMADEAERQDRDNIIKQLQEQELLEKYVQDDLAASRKLQSTKSGTKSDLTAQMNLKRREAEQEKRRQLEFRKETEAKLAALDAKEHEKEMKKKEKARQYSIELKRQIEENARKRETERRLEDARAQAVWDYHKDCISQGWGLGLFIIAQLSIVYVLDWRHASLLSQFLTNNKQAEVSKEREKIVKEHVPHILGYIQAGVIGKADLPAVRAGANESPELAKLDIESMAGSADVNRHPKCNAQCRILREF